MNTVMISLKIQALEPCVRKFTNTELNNCYNELLRLVARTACDVV